MKAIRKLPLQAGLFALLALGVCESSLAAGTARVSTMSAAGKRVLTNLDFTSPGNLRATAVLQGGSVLVLRDGQAFAQTGDDERPLGTPDQVAAMGITLPNTGDAVVRELISLKNTGRKEERAGLVGDIYEMNFFDDQGRRRTEQIVVSNDPRARELTDLWASVNTALMPGVIPATGDLQRKLQDNGLGLLRFSHRYQVDRINYAVRLPPVQALAPQGDLNSTGLSGASASTGTAGMAEPAPVLIDASYVPRTRKFNQGSLFGALFGRSAAAAPSEQ